MSYLKISALVLLACLHGCGGSDEEKARNFVIKGQTHLAEGNRDTAKIEFTNALRLDPSSSDALYELSRFFEEDRNWPQFEEYLKRLLTLVPDHHEARLKLTHFYIGSNQIELAKGHAEYLLKNAPKNKDITLAQAAILYKTSKDEEARTLVNEVLKEAPGNVDAVFLLSNDHIQKTEFSEALTLLDSGLKAHPDDFILNMTKINVLSRMNDWKSVIPVYKHLMAVFPENPAPPASLAQGYVRSGDVNEAVAVLESYAQSNKNEEFFIKAIELIGTSEGAEKAESKLRSYIKSNPDLYQLRFALADIYTKSGNIEQAYTEVSAIKSSTTDQNIALQAMNRLARMDIVSGKIDQAKTTIASILKQSPENASALALKSNMLINDNQAQEAIKVLRGALRNQPKSAELLMTLGRAHEQEKQWELADENYAKSLQLSPNNILQTVHYAEFLMRRKNLKRAEELLSPLVASGTNNISTLKIYASIMLNNREWDKALKTATIMEAGMADKSEVARLQGLAYAGKQDFTSAISSLKKYYELSPDSTEAMNLLVQSYVQSNNRAQAELLIKDIIKRESFSFSGYILKGNVHTHYNELTDAEAAYSKAVAISSKQPQGHDSLIKVLMQTNQLDKAKAAIDNALLVFPDNVPLSLYEATLYQRLNQNHKSIEIYQKLLDKNPELDVVANNLAVLLQKMGGEDNLKRAAKVAERFRQSKIPQFQDTLGWIYSLQGNLEEASSLLRRAAEKLPEEAEVQYHLGVTYQLANKTAKAKEHLEAALALANKQKLDSPWISDANMAMSKIK